jgi:hypothetical protein
MFDTNWSILGNILALFLILIVKHFLVGLIENTSAYKAKMSQGQGWMAFLNVTAGLNAVLTFLIFLIPVGRLWALAYAVIDFAIHWLFGYYRAKGKLPTVSAGNLQTAEGWLSKLSNWYGSINSASFLGMAASAVTLLQSKGSIVTDLLTFLKGF